MGVPEIRDWFRSALGRGLQGVKFMSEDTVWKNPRRRAVQLTREPPLTGSLAGFRACFLFLTPSCPTTYLDLHGCGCQRFRPFRRRLPGGMGRDRPPRFESPAFLSSLCRSGAFSRKRCGQGQGRPPDFKNSGASLFPHASVGFCPFEFSGANSAFFCQIGDTNDDSNDKG